MITKNKTPEIRKILYLVLIPVIVFITQSFSDKEKTNNPPSIRPVKGGEITCEFGFTGNNPITNELFTHGGIDIKVELGTPVVSTASGEVITVLEKEGWGKFIIIKHDEHFETLYTHLDKFKVKPGDKVTKGQVIGLSGNTGQSTGPHLHYEVRKDEVKVNPEEYFK